MARKRDSNVDFQKLVKSSTSKKKKKKQISDEEKQILLLANKDFAEGIKWLYNEIVKKRSYATKEILKNIRKQINIRNNGERKNILYTLKDICKIVNWKFPENKSERKKLSNLSSILFLNGIDPHPILFNFTMKALKEDVKNPSDLLLNNKERKAAKKRRKIEKRTGKTNIKFKAAKSDDEKKNARKERARIRKEAKKLGISTKEYKEKYC